MGTYLLGVIERSGWFALFDSSASIHGMIPILVWRCCRIYFIRHIMSRRVEIWCRWQSPGCSFDNWLAHGITANTQRFWLEGLMIFFETWSARKRPPIKTYKPEIFATAGTRDSLTTHGTENLLIHAWICSHEIGQGICGYIKPPASVSWSKVFFNFSPTFLAKIHCFNVMVELRHLL